MGFEYKIAFLVSDPDELEAFLVRLRESMQQASQPDYQVSLEADGFYFCDYTKSDRASEAFRRLVDKALNYSEVVIHEL